MNKPPRIDALDSLRGLAAIFIALFHYQTTSPLTDNPFIQNSYLMVDFFFVLSGFATAYHYHDRLNTIPQWIDFQKKRFARLYPLHFIMLSVFLAIECAKYYFEHHTGIHANSPAFTKNTGNAYLQNVLLIHGMGALRHLTFNYPSWAVSTLFFTYGVYSFLVLSMRRTDFKWVALIFTLLCLDMLLYYGEGLHLDLRTAFVRCMYSFFIGVLGFLAYQRFSSKISSSFWPLLLAFLIFLTMLFSDAMGGHVYFIPALFCGLVVTIACLPETSALRYPLDHPMLTHLGRISYSVYMIHAFVWWGIHQTLRFIFHMPVRTDAHGLTTPALDPTMATATTLTGLAIIITLSHFSYRYIERMRLK